MLLQNGIFGGRLPPNVRIISNFFRTAPDGSVKGFSKPIVHPGNKNATTASIQMDMQLPERQYALVNISQLTCMNNYKNEIISFYRYLDLKSKM